MHAFVGDVQKTKKIIKLEKNNEKNFADNYYVNRVIKKSLIFDVIRLERWLIGKGGKMAETVST